jgi:hypothetical protein
MRRPSGWLHGSVEMASRYRATRRLGVRSYPSRAT